MASDIPDKLYFKIGEVSRITGIEPYILRYWESEFKLVKPYRTKSNQRLYRKKDVETVFTIKEMLYTKKFTIAGAKKQLKETAAPPQRQLPLSFSQAKYQEALRDTKEELQELADMLRRTL